MKRTLENKIGSGFSRALMIDLRSTMQDIEIGGRVGVQAEVNNGATFHLTVT